MVWSRRELGLKPHSRQVRDFTFVSVNDKHISSFLMEESDCKSCELEVTLKWKVYIWIRSDQFWWKSYIAIIKHTDNSKLTSQTFVYSWNN